MDRKSELSFRLAGKSWRVISVDLAKGVCRVAPAPRGRVPNWLGPPNYLSWDICQQMKQCLAEGDSYSWLTPPARDELAWLRREYSMFVHEGEAPMEIHEDRIQWHTFAGGTINRLLAIALERLGAGSWTAGNLSLQSRDSSTQSKLDEALGALASADWDGYARELVSRNMRMRTNKFQDCLPDDMNLRTQILQACNIDGTRSFVANHSVPLLR